MTSLVCALRTNHYSCFPKDGPAVRAAYTRIALLRVIFCAAFPALVLSACTPRFWATVEGNEAIVRVLIEAGAGANLKDDDGNTPLRRAESNGDQVVVQLLRSHRGRPHTIMFLCSMTSSASPWTTFVIS
jgi:ankyrin repeat protein